MTADLTELLAEASTALEEGNFARALETSEAALKLEPDELEALAISGTALAELGEWARADAVFAQLMEREPDEPSWVLSAAETLIRQPGDDRARIEAGLELLEQLEDETDERVAFDVLTLGAAAHNELGELEVALEQLEAALKLRPRDPEARLERANTLFELCRFEEAKGELTALAREQPGEPWPRHTLGLLAERAGDEAEARALFAKATALDPEAFPEPVRLGEAEFDAAVKQAIAALPEHAKAELGNVTISVEPFPDDEALASGEISPAVLGVFVGTPLDERNPTVAEHHHTASIVLFQRNLERFAATKEELIEQIGITVLHEVGHLLGLDEDELYERGLD